MRTRTTIILASLIFFGAVIYFSAAQKPFPTNLQLESGDIIFRKENSLWGDMASAAARIDGTYSHSGIIYLEDGKIYVIHAYANTQKQQAKVSKEPLADFLRNSTAAAYYRLSFPIQIRTEVARNALEYYKHQTPFDDKFSLDDDRELYCTELVWRSVKTASGHDIAPIKSNLMGKIFIGNDDLFLGGFMKKLF